MFLVFIFCLFFHATLFNQDYVIDPIIHEKTFYNVPSHKKILFFKHEMNIKEGDLVFDIGANNGQLAEMFLACGAHVVCFEPQPSCLEVLNRKFKLNDRVIIEPVGLGSQDGVLDFYICSKANTISSFSPDFVQTSRFAQRGYSWDKKIQVPVKRLEAMVAKYGIPNFCKIDVEGFEYDVVSGLKNPIGSLSFEINFEFFEKSSVNVIEYLASLGYNEFNFIIANSDTFVFKQWLSSQVFIDELRKLGSKNWKQVWLGSDIWGDAYARIR